MGDAQGGLVNGVGPLVGGAAFCCGVGEPTRAVVPLGGMRKGDSTLHSSCTDSAGTVRRPKPARKT